MEEYTSHISSNALKKKKRREIDPFVVFTADMRPSVAQSNPGCTSSEITAILGAMWRSMSPTNKRKYQLISQSLDNFECKPRKPSPIHPLPTIQSQAEEANQGIEEQEIKLPIPNIRVVPRGNSGVEASKASEELFRNSKH